MQNIYPEFYNTFRCIAADCPDSCCKDWDVVVDDESAQYYNSLSGEFGEKLRSRMIIDGDGDRIFALQNGRCPFWNNGKLCDIYINAGEQHLCKTCRQFPRLTQDYTVFAEHMLSFACPEAARIMIKTNDFTECFHHIKLDKSEDYCYTAELMENLLFHRQESARIFMNNSQTFTERLIGCLEYNRRVQAELDGFEEINGYADTNRVFALHSRLDIMNKNWLEILKDSKDCSIASNKEIDREFANIALYYLFRYYLAAIDNFNVLSTIKRIACAYIVISKIISYENAENNFEKRVMIAQQYSKEVEHSYENSELLESEFETNGDFSAVSFINMLKSK